VSDASGVEETALQEQTCGDHWQTPHAKTRHYGIHDIVGLAWWRRLQGFQRAVIECSLCHACPRYGNTLATEIAQFSVARGNGMIRNVMHKAS
jgi:hypothetical protein